jgi:ATP-binding cassette subfamily F protein 3
MHKAAASPKESNKAHMKNKRKAKPTESFEQIESQIKQLEKDIQHDENVGSNYNKHIEDASFFKAYNKKESGVR